MPLFLEKHTEAFILDDVERHDVCKLSSNSSGGKCLYGKGIKKRERAW